MAKYSKERLEELRQKTRRALIRNPNLSARGLAAEFKLDKDFANKLLNQVRAENAERIKKDVEKLQKTTVAEEMATMEREITELATELWNIINDKRTVRKDKINAIKALVETRKNLFNLKFDAGLFSRKLGEMSLNIPQLVEELKKNANKPQGTKDSTGDTEL